MKCCLVVLSERKNPALLWQPRVLFTIRGGSSAPTLACIHNSYSPNLSIPLPHSLMLHFSSFLKVPQWCCTFPPTVRSKENKFHQSNLVAHTLLLPCNGAKLQQISSPPFHAHVPLVQITCSLIPAVPRPCSLAKELEDGSQERRRVGRFS